ncbi:hypothetical protein CCZ01_09590 [Helicobacter monodelphidis]|uniref:VapD family protein n=1 Tax=Helicobacter sp. 15-1451 TaxID=2004995 RepID=UPI000DCEF3C0|nr:VapD family protein [Helicobacter sp. 15-1451]RAX56414.1 hypothetical protein CCZ01_09590 [Helicobacter sp. 15-1451]
MNEARFRKAIHFDLSTNELKKFFADTRKPYSQIKQFMLKNGFEHSQYSGYISKEPMDRNDISNIAKKLGRAFTWLESSMQRMQVTNVDEFQFDVETIVRESAKMTETPPRSKQGLRNRRK